VREYNYKRKLVTGLRRRSEAGRNTDALVEATFIKPVEDGLRSASTVVNPFAESPYSAFPFPQLIRGSSVTLLAGKTSLGLVDTSANIWTSSAIVTYDAYSPTQQKSIPAGGVWQFIDCFNTWFLLNGSCVVYKTHRVGMITSEADRVFVQDTVDVNTGCAFKGRVLFGGFNPDTYWTSAWQTIWNDYAATFGFNISRDMPVGENFVMWSSIGGGDVLNLFHADVAVDGYIGEDTRSNLFLDYYKRNEAGLLPIPYPGTIRVLKPLGNGVAVYSENGVGVLYPVIDPVPTFGFQPLLNIGIPDRGAVGGDDTVHAFVDTGGKLRTISADYKTELLDYGEYLTGFLGQDMAISYDRGDMEFYISGVNEGGDRLTYVLTKNGLGRSPQHVTSGFFAEGALLGVFKQERSTEVIMVTDVIDFELRDLKLITTVELGAEFSGAAWIAVDYRYSKTDPFTRSEWVLLNDEGFARVQKAGVEFRVCVKCSTYIGLKMDYINVRWGLAGKRIVRGIYAEQA